MDASQADSRPVPLPRDSGQGPQPFDARGVVEPVVVENPADLLVEVLRNACGTDDRGPEVPPAVLASQLEQWFRRAAVPASDNAVQLLTDIGHHVASPPLQQRDHAIAELQSPPLRMVLAELIAEPGGLANLVRQPLDVAAPLREVDLAAIERQASSRSPASRQASIMPRHILRFSLAPEAEPLRQVLQDESSTKRDSRSRVQAPLARRAGTSRRTRRGRPPARPAPSPPDTPGRAPGTRLPDRRLHPSPANFHLSNRRVSQVSRFRRTWSSQAWSRGSCSCHFTRRHP